MSEAIKEAIRQLKQANTGKGLSIDWAGGDDTLAVCVVLGEPAKAIIAALESALRAQEQNEPLTVVPFVITMANGKPVDYDALGKRYRKEILEYDIDGIYVNEDGRMVLVDDCGNCVWLNSDEFAITREPEHAPEKGESHE